MTFAILSFLFAVANGIFWGVTGARRGWSLLKTCFVSFVVCEAVLLAAITFVSTDSHADTTKAMSALRSTSVMVNAATCSGSGSIVEGRSGHRFLLTNAHVCNCARVRGEVYGTFEGGELVKAKVVKQDWSADLCAARVEDSRTALKLAPRLLPLTSVHTRGYPGGRLTESNGRVGNSTDWDTTMDISELGECPAGSSKERGMNGNVVACTLHFRSTLTTLYARPGSSGSPVVNDDGELVGVLSSWHPDNFFDGGIVPYNDTRKFVDSL